MAGNGSRWSCNWLWQPELLPVPAVNHSNLNPAPKCLHTWVQMDKQCTRYSLAHLGTEGPAVHQVQLLQMSPHLPELQHVLYAPLLCCSSTFSSFSSQFLDLVHIFLLLHPPALLLCNQTFFNFFSFNGFWCCSKCFSVVTQSLPRMFFGG